MYFRIFIFYFFAALLMYSCTYTEPLFAGIETEEKIETGNLPDKITTLGMARIGSYYLIASGGAIYYRQINGGDWSTYTLPSGYEGSIKIVEATAKTEAYAVLVKDYITTPSEYAVFKITSGSPFSFTKIHSSTQFIDIFAVSDTDGATSANIFALVGSFSVSETNSVRYYQNYQNSSPDLLTLTQADFPDKTDLESQSEMIIDIAYNTDDNKYYLANESSVFSVETGNKLKTINPIVNRVKVPWGYIGGLYYYEIDSTNKKLLVSSARSTSNSGLIWYSSDNGSTWNSKEGDAYTFYTRFKYIDQSSFTGVVVGTQYNKRNNGRDKGYFEMLDGNPSSLTTPSGNKYTSGKLDTSAVTGFYVGENVFFVFTKSLGLWRGNYGSSRVVDWFLE